MESRQHMTYDANSLIDSTGTALKRCFVPLCITFSSNLFTLVPDVMC